MKPLVASFSLFNTWAICPHQAYRRYIARDLPRQPETPEQKWGNEVHRAMERRIREKAPLPENMLSFEPLVAPLDAYHVEPEKKLGVTAAGRPCDFFADDVWLRGVFAITIGKKAINLRLATKRKLASVTEGLGIPSKPAPNSP